MANAEHGSTVLNKIIIPVITTVLGATAIYFLGFNKKGGKDRSDMEQMLISKEATMKAWRSFVTIQNVSYKNEKSLMDEMAQKMAEAKKTARSYADFVPILKDFEDEIMRERKKATQDVESIAKDPDVDRDFLSMLNRILDNSKDYDKKITDFFDNFISIARSDQDETEKGKKITAVSLKFEESEKKMNDRVMNEAEGIAKTLSEKYTQAFNLNDLDVYADLKKEQAKKPEPSITNTPGGPAPVDPNAGAGAEVKSNNPPSDNGGSAASSYTNDRPTYTGNKIEPTKTLLTGIWTMTGGELELSADGQMFWTFDNRGYTSGDWKLEDGKLKMNATNPDTRRTSVLIGYLSDFSRNSFTITFMSSPKEVYHLTRDDDD